MLKWLLMTIWRRHDERDVCVVVGEKGGDVCIANLCLGLPGTLGGSWGSSRGSGGGGELLFGGSKRG